MLRYATMAVTLSNWLSTGKTNKQQSTSLCCPCALSTLPGGAPEPLSLAPATSHLDTVDNKPLSS